MVLPKASSASRSYRPRIAWTPIAAGFCLVLTLIGTSTHNYTQRGTMNPVAEFALLTMLGLLFIGGIFLTFKLRGIAW